MKTALAMIAVAFVGCADQPEDETTEQTISASKKAFIFANQPSLGGSSSSGNGINDLGIAMGQSNLAGDAAAHAVLWFFGVPIDLHTLGGDSSNIAWPVKNVLGVFTGISETRDPRPYGEAWSCAEGGFFPDSGHACRGFVWAAGHSRTLPTLGGPNGFATGTNNRGTIVGWAENNVMDSTCVHPDQVLQFKAVTWDLLTLKIHELPTSPGFSTAAATAVNDRGQIVGISGDCGIAVGGVSARRAVMWDHGRVIDLGNLGGTAWNTPMSINSRGDVVGFGNVPRADGTTTDGFNGHGFIWTAESGMKEIKPLGDDVFSEALGINDQRQVVGLSCTAHFATCRAFYWENGVAQDMNEMLAGDYADHIYSANDINNFGLITGQALSAADGHQMAFVGFPTRIR